VHKCERREVWRAVQSRWWRRPIRYDVICDNPGLIVGIESVSPEITKAERGSAIYLDDSADPPFEKDERPQVAHLTRQDAFETACFLLGISSPGARFFDPIPPSSLQHLPSQAANRICYIAKRCNVGLVDTVRPVNRAFRLACEPLSGALVSSRCGHILLSYHQRQHCLLRYRKDAATRNISAGSGRAAACKITLLSEAEHELRKEIAYFEDHDGKILPSACRFIKPCPFTRYREDGRSVEDLFLSQRRPG
jgi:hypothetical protein